MTFICQNCTNVVERKASKAGATCSHKCKVALRLKRRTTILPIGVEYQPSGKLLINLLPTRVFTCATHGRQTARGNNTQCIPCRRARHQEKDKYQITKDQYYTKNRKLLNEKQRLRRYQVEYGLMYKDAVALRDAQGNVCAICAQQMTDKGRLRWCLDHNHTTGQIREILCNNCNTALGLLNEDPNRCAAMVKYINKHLTENTSYSTLPLDPKLIEGDTK